MQSASREITLSTDVVKSIPTVRSYNGIVVIVPGVVTNLNDTVTGTATTQFPIHGGRNNEGRLTIDGLNIGNPPGGNQPPAYIADVGNAQEVTFITSGGLGETETAGLTMNIVPRTGGNRTTGSLFFSGTGQNFQANNLTPELQAQGVAAADAARRRSTTSTAPSADRSSRTRSGTTSTRARRAARRRSRASTPTPMPATRPSGCTCPISTTRCTRTARGKT